MVDFQKNIAQFDEQNVTIVCASVDKIEDAIKTRDNHKLTFPVAYELEGEHLSELTGAFYDKDRRWSQGTGFLIDPDGKVAQAVYSTGPNGRYTAAEILKLIGYKTGKK